MKDQARGGARELLFLLCGGLLGLGLLGGGLASGGCKGSRVGDYLPEPDVAPAELFEGPPSAARHVSLPPPLRPKGGLGIAEPEDGTRPCTILVNRVCSILSEGAEECSEARTRINRQPGTISHERCDETLAWFRAVFDNVKPGRVPNPCKLLAEEKCKTFGERSTGCVHARADVVHLSRTLQPACKAELLLFRGFGP